MHRARVCRVPFLSPQGRVPGRCGPPLLPTLGLCQCPRGWRCFGDGQPNLLLRGLWLQGGMDRQTAAQGVSSPILGRGGGHCPTHLPAACSRVGFLSADDQVLVIVAITLPGISLYVCLPPCLRCSNSCVCFSLLPPPSLDYHCERKHAAHRALQSSGGGACQGQPHVGTGPGCHHHHHMALGCGCPPRGGDRAGATVAAFGWSADAPTVVSRGGGLSVLLLSSVFSPEHLHSNEEIWAFSCFSARSCHVFPLPKRGLVVVYCNFFPPPLPRSRCCWCSVSCSLQPPQSCTVHPAPL